MPRDSRVIAVASDHPSCSQSAQPENTAGMLSNSVWTQEAAAVPAVKLPTMTQAIPAVTDGEAHADTDRSPVEFSDVVSRLNVADASLFSLITIGEGPVLLHPARSVPSADVESTDETSCLHVSVANGAAISSADASYVDGSAFSPIFAPSMSAHVSLTLELAPSPSLSLATSPKLALPSLDVCHIHSPIKDSTSSDPATTFPLKPAANLATVAVPSPAATSPVTLPHRSVKPGFSVDRSPRPSLSGKDASFANDQIIRPSLSPSLRITPTRRKSALELASLIATQKSGQCRIQSTPPHTTVDRLRLAIAAERALGRRPDLAARINSALASTSATPTVAPVPLMSSLRFVRPAPQYAFKRHHPNNVAGIQAATIRAIPQFVGGESLRVPKASYGELLGYVEVDAW